MTRTFLTTMFLSLAACSLHAQVLTDKYWAYNTRFGVVYEVDMAAQVLTQINNTGFGSNVPSAGGGASLNNSFYVTSGDIGDSVDINRIDIESGNVEPIAPLPAQADNSRAFTANTATGELLGVGALTDTLYITRVLQGETESVALGVITPEIGAPVPFGRAIGGAFDNDNQLMYVITDDLPSDTIHLWRLECNAAGEPQTVAAYIGDTGIDSQENLIGSVSGSGGQDCQTGLAFDAATGDLVMSSAVALTVEFYTIDPATATPTLEFIWPEWLALDSLAPANVGYSARADSADIPVAISADRRDGTLYVATEASELTTPVAGSLQPAWPLAFFPGGLTPGVDVEFATSDDTGNPDAAYAVNDNGQFVIVPLSSSPLALTLSSQGVTTGTLVGIARRGEDLYFTSGIGVPGALYRFDSDASGAISFFSTNLEDDASALEYVAATDMFYYYSTDTMRIHSYDPVADVSAEIGRPAIGSNFPNFAIDPQGRFAYFAEDDRIAALSLDPGLPPARFIFADNLPMNRSGQHDLVFARSSDGSGSMSLFAAVNGRQDPAPPQVLEFAGFAADPCGPADLTTTNTNPGDKLFGVGDGLVDGADLSFYIEQWLTGNATVADVTTTNTNPGDSGYGMSDGVADGADLSYYVEAWLNGCA